MCLAKVYVGTGGEKKLLMEEIASLKFQEGKLLVTTLFGEQKEIKARVKEIDFMASRVLLENGKS